MSEELNQGGDFTINKIVEEATRDFMAGKSAEEQKKLEEIS